jgi:archaemetzincin
VQLYILSFEFSNKDLLVSISAVLKEIFELPVILLDRSFPLEQGRDPIRNQYNSTWILSQLLTLLPEGNCKILGLTELDLYIPVLTYVFGEAQLNGRTAVVSSYRLRDELYGLPKNLQKLKERLEKEAVHELGHTFGLIHCRTPNCVMYPTTYAEEIDFKTKNFCSACLSILKKNKEQL